MVMKYDTPLMPPSVWTNLNFKCKQHTTHDPRGPEKLKQHNKSLKTNSIIGTKCYFFRGSKANQNITSTYIADIFSTLL